MPLRVHSETPFTPSFLSVDDSSPSHGCNHFIIDRLFHPLHPRPPPKHSRTCRFLTSPRRGPSFIILHKI